MVDPGHPPAWVVDLYSADPALVEPSAAAHLDTCAECRRAVGLPIVESAPPARDPPLRLRPWWRRPSVLVGAAAALAAALVVGVRMAAVPSDTSPIGAAPHGVKGPTRGGEVTLALRAGESLTVFAPDSGITPSPGDTLVFLAENPHVTRSSPTSKPPATRAFSPPLGVRSPALRHSPWDSSWTHMWGDNA